MGLKKLLTSFTKGIQVFNVINEAIDQIDKNTEEITTAKNKIRGEQNITSISPKYSLKNLYDFGNKTFALKSWVCSELSHLKSRCVPSDMTSSIPGIASDSWIRVPLAGIIPYKSGFGIGTVGTSTWLFEAMYSRAFLPFTGCHIAKDEGQCFKKGYLVCIEDINNEPEEANLMQPVWSARYCTKEQKGIFGVVFGYNIDAIMKDYEEEIIIKNKFKKNKVEIITKQRQIGENKTYSIACLGDCKVYACGENGNITYGDELCASSMKGVVMKADESLHRTQICGKAGASISFKDNKEIILLSTAKE